MPGEYDSNGIHNDQRPLYIGDASGLGSYPGWDGVAQAPARDPYVAFALRWWWVLLIGAILGTAGAFAYLRYGPVPYTSTAIVQVSPPAQTDPTEDTGQASKAAASFAAEAASPRMFGMVSKTLGTDVGITTRELSKMAEDGAIKIKGVKESTLLQISVTNSDPARAHLLAETIAKVLVSDVNARAAARLEARITQLSRQIDITRDRLATAQLQARATDLKQELAGQRTLLLQLQLNYQQELQRSEELNVAEGGAKQSGASASQLKKLQAEWQRVVGQQIKDVEKNVSEITGELKTVQHSLSKLPSSADPTVSSALAGAYGMQLQDITKEYAALQLTGQETVKPLTQYGNASEPAPASGAKKTLMMGFAGGLALSGGLAYVISLLLAWRGTRKGATQATAPGEHIAVSELMERLERIGYDEDGARVARIAFPERS